MTAPSLLEWLEAQPKGIDDSHDQRIDALTNLIEAIDQLLFKTDSGVYTCVGTFTMGQIEGLFPVVRFEVPDVGVIHLKPSALNYIISCQLVAPISLNFDGVAYEPSWQLDTEVTEGFPDAVLPKYRVHSNRHFVVMTERGIYDAYAALVLIKRRLAQVGHARY